MTDAEMTGTSPNETTNATISGSNGATINPQEVYQPALGFARTSIDDETILVDLLTNTYLRLNATGTFIWNLLEQGTTVQAMSDKLAQQFGLPANQAEDVVSSFVRELVQWRAAAPVRQAGNS